MKKIDLHQVDAFTDVIFGGNPAGVVTNADGLTDHQMADIAREMNLSETAFVSAPTIPGADFQLRWFTPTTEVDFCGHATIGTLCELARLKLYGLGRAGLSEVQVQTKSGLLAMSSSIEAGRITATFTAPTLRLEPYRLQGEAFATALGIPSAALPPEAKILIDTTLNDIYLPIISTKSLESLEFDFAHIRRQFSDENIIVFGLFAVEGNTLNVRGLAPLAGVDEDPFTGRLQAGLMMTAQANNLIAKTQNEIATRQGHTLGRPGQAHIARDATSGVIHVTGTSAHVFSTTLELA